MQTNQVSEGYTPRVAFIVHYVTDYRLPLYQELEKRGNVDFTLIHSSKCIKDKAKPATGMPICSKTIDVRSYEGSIGKLKFVFQPKALWLIIRSNFKFVFCQSGRSLITNSFVLLYCRLTKTPFFWWTGSWERPFNTSFAQIILDAYQECLWKMADGAIVYNSAAKEKLIKIGMNEKRIFIAQNT